MNNEELYHRNTSRPDTPHEEEIRTLLVCLLELVAVRGAEKIQQRISAEARENSPKRASPDSGGLSGRR